MMTEYAIKIKSGAKGDLKKIVRSPYTAQWEDIKETLKTNPYSPKHHFEKLTPPAAGFYSRRITGMHRVVYKIYEKPIKKIVIYSMWAHYAVPAHD